MPRRLGSPSAPWKQTSAYHAISWVLLPQITQARRRRLRQGNDRGASYRSAIFYFDEDQRHTADDTIADVDAQSGTLARRKVVTEVVRAGAFWEAEAEHQDYLQRHPNGYTCHFPRPGWVLPDQSDAIAS